MANAAACNMFENDRFSLGSTRVPNQAFDPTTMDCDTPAQDSQGRFSRLREKVLPLTQSRKPKPRWPDPEASVGDFCGMSKRVAYWEAIGPAREAFDQLGPDITQVLEKAEIIVPAPHFLMFECFMVGKVQASAVPRIMFSCRHEASRTRATDLLRKSGILNKYPGLDTGSWPWPPHEGPSRLTGSSGHATLESSLVKESDLFSEPIYTTSEHIAPLISALRVCSNTRPWEKRILATIGCTLYLAGVRLLVTVAHALCSAPPNLDHSQHDLDQEGDNLVDFGDLEDDFDEDLSSSYTASTGVYTDDSQFTSEDEALDEFEPPQHGLIERDYEVDSQNQSPPEPLNNGYDDPGVVDTSDKMALDEDQNEMVDDVRTHDTRGSELEASQSTLSAVYTSQSFDYALMKRPLSDNPETISGIPLLDWDSLANEPTDNSPMYIKATTGVSGQISGLLCRNRIYTLLPGCKKFVRAFTAQLDHGLVEGDSGSIALDAATNRILGLLIGTVARTGMAYIMPARNILEDLATIDSSVVDQVANLQPDSLSKTDGMSTVMSICPSEERTIQPIGVSSVAMEVENLDIHSGGVHLSHDLACTSQATQTASRIHEQSDQPNEDDMIIDYTDDESEISMRSSFAGSLASTNITAPSSAPSHRTTLARLGRVTETKALAKIPLGHGKNVLGNPDQSSSDQGAAIGESAQSAAPRIGRPPQWTNSRSRKLARLYIYTTLPVEKIIHALFTDDNVPKKNTAQKTLHKMLGPDPRKLRPDTRNEMKRRLNWLTKDNSKLATMVARDESKPAEMEWDEHDQASLPTGWHPDIKNSMPPLAQYSATENKQIETIRDDLSAGSVDSEILPVPTVNRIRPFSFIEHSPAIPEPRFAVAGDVLSLWRYNQTCFGSHSSTNQELCWGEVTQQVCHLDLWVHLDGGISQAAQDEIRLSSVSLSTRRDPFGHSILHLLAALEGFEDQLVSIIPRQQQLIHVVNTAGQTFLHTLGPSWDGNHLNKLLDCLGSSPVLDTRDVYGRTFIHALAAQRRPAELIQTALIYHPSITGRDAYGNEPPFSNKNAAALPSSPNIEQDAADYETNGEFIRDQNNLIRLMIESDTTPSAEDAKGRNHLHALAEIVDPDKVFETSPRRVLKQTRTLKDRQEESNEPWRVWQLRGHLGLGGLNHYSKDGNTVLMAFISHVEEDREKSLATILTTLVAGGSSLEARNRHGETALLVAAKFGNRLALEALLDLGANVHVRDGRGCGILDLLHKGIKMSKRHLPSHGRLLGCLALLIGQRGVDLGILDHPTFVDEWGMRAVVEEEEN